MTTAAYGQTRTADVLYTYVDDTPTHGYRVGDECFVPIEDVSNWGWQVELKGDTASVTAEGVDFTIGVRTISGRNSLPVRAALAKLGGTADWIVNTDTLQVVSDLTSVSVDSGRIKVSSPLKVKPKPFVLTDPSRVVIDFIGAHIGKKTTQALEGGVRLNQYKPNVVRLVIQTAGIADVSKIPIEPTKSTDIELSIGPAPDDKVAQTDVKATPPDKTTQSEDTKSISKAEPGVIDGTAQTQSSGILPLAIDREDDRSAFLTIKFRAGLKAPAQFRKPAPDVMEIVLPGINMDLPADFKLATGTVTAATSQRSPQGTVVRLNLARPLGAEVVTQGQTVLIQLLKPNVGDGRLVGKVIVVDAGHGGHDSGATAASVKEKDFNLILAHLLSERLTEQGATVIMTRTTDVFIPLTTRADIANNSHADFFISCHINHTGDAGNMSGGITFHHMGKPISRVLAECIQQQIASVSGIPSLGVWSDAKIYSTIGFSVLRNIKMPGVLIEFGFINNAHDRKTMATSEFQDSVTKAVVRGLKVYLGDAKTN